MKLFTFAAAMALLVVAAARQDPADKRVADLEKKVAELDKRVAKLEAGKGDAGAEKVKVIQKVLKEIAAALDFYQMDNGKFPTTDQGLKALVEKPASEPVPAKWQKYIVRLPTDSWDNAFVYKCPGVKNPKGYDLSSAGPDGKDGTDDDIFAE